MCAQRTLCSERAHAWSLGFVFWLCATLVADAGIALLAHFLLPPAVAFGLPCAAFRLFGLALCYACVHVFGLIVAFCISMAKMYSVASCRILSFHASAI